MNRKIENFIKESDKKYKKHRKHFSTKNNVQVYIKDFPPDGFDIEYVFNKVENLIPRQLFYNLDSVFIGQFDEFHERNINAFYNNSAIYVTNLQDDEDDMIDDIIHELSHSVEEIESSEIYEDRYLEQEFLGKRKRLFSIIKNEGYNISGYDFLNPEYSLQFDEFLYQEVGYPKLVNMTMGLFLSPYSVTSLREYFAAGFEEYYLKNKNYIKKTCPVLFQKIELISN